MRCPFCLHPDSMFLVSRQTEEGGSIRRRRECTACLRRVTTYERVDEMPFLVVKKDGRLEPFSRAKILNGIRRACEKRPISSETNQKPEEPEIREERYTMAREITSTYNVQMI